MTTIRKQSSKLRLVLLPARKATVHEGSEARQTLAALLTLNHRLARD